MFFNKRQDEMLGAIREIVALAKETAEASKMQAEAFKEFLAAFKTDAPPTSRVTRDEDEWRAEMIRKGYPVDASPQEQALWVLRNSSF